MDDEKLIRDIENHGFAVIMIEATDYLPSFGFTIGLWKKFNHPELICFGLPVTILHQVLNVGGELVKTGSQLQPGIDYEDFFENGTSHVVPVDPRNIKDYFGYAIWFNETSSFPALQLVWTDRNNKYPWESGFESAYKFIQPLLDRNADFKFLEELNLAVFTTRQWLEEKRPILRVVHEEDGDWQFLTCDQLPEDGRIVGLEQIIKRDPELNELFNLDYGEYAERAFVGDSWYRGLVKNTLLLFILIFSNLFVVAQNIQFRQHINKDSLLTISLLKLPEHKRAEFKLLYTQGQEQEKDFLLFMLSLPTSSKQELINNYENRKTEIAQLKSSFQKYVPADRYVRIEFEAESSILTIPEHVNISVYKKNNKSDVGRSDVFMRSDGLVEILSGTNLVPESEELKKIIASLGWTTQMLAEIKSLLDKANCISIENMEHINIGFARSGMGLYSYLLFQNALNSNLKNRYNDGC